MVIDFEPFDYTVSRANDSGRLMHLCFPLIGIGWPVLEALANGPSRRRTAVADAETPLPKEGEATQVLLPLWDFPLQPVIMRASYCCGGLAVG